MHIGILADCASDLHSKHPARLHGKVKHCMTRAMPILYAVLFCVLVSAAQAASDHWAYRPLSKPPLPSAGGKSPSNPIDAFILSKLVEKALHPSAQAPRSVLIRRVYYDLIGLPPSAEELDQFAADPSDAHYAAIVDRLLAS